MNTKVIHIGSDANKFAQDLVFLAQTIERDAGVIISDHHVKSALDFAQTRPALKNLMDHIIVVEQNHQYFKQQFDEILSGIGEIEIVTAQAFEEPEVPSRLKKASSTYGPQKKKRW